MPLYPEYPEYFVRLPSGELNEVSCCKLAGYHELICAAAEGELSRCAESVTDTVKQGFAWAITSMTVDVLRPIDSCRELSCQTWISITQPPYSRREMCVADTSGDVCFKVSLFFVPLDISTHRIKRGVPLYDTERFFSGDALIEEAVQRHSDPKNYVFAAERVVRASDIDALGHMNNCRYGAMIYDAIPREERQIFSRPFRYIIDFRRQLCEGDKVTIEICSDNGVRCIRGINADNKVSFSAQLLSI